MHLPVGLLALWTFLTAVPLIFQGLISCKKLYVTLKGLKREGKISREEQRIVIVSPAD